MDCAQGDTSPRTQSPNILQYISETRTNRCIQTNSGAQKKTITETHKHETT